MSISATKNIGAYLHAALALTTAQGVASTATAGVSGSGTEVSGVAVDRFLTAEPNSASVLYSIAATLASTKTLTLTYAVQHSANGTTGWADLSRVSAAVVLTGASGGAAQSLLVKHDVDLSGAMEFVRVDFTPTLSATATDTVSIAPVFVFGGMAIRP